MACLLVVFCITAPYASLELKPIAAFIPVYATLSVFTDLLTAILILAQFRVVGWAWLLVLASGYLFTALMTVSGALSYPGVFSPAVHFGWQELQTASWIGTSYQLASPMFLIAAVLGRGSSPATGTLSNAHPARLSRSEHCAGHHNRVRPDLDHFRIWRNHAADFREQRATGL